MKLTETQFKISNIEFNFAGYRQAERFKRVVYYPDVPEWAHRLQKRMTPIKLYILGKQRFSDKYFYINCGFQHTVAVYTEI